MTIEQDFETIRLIQRAEKAAGRRYIIASPTPQEIPFIRTDAKITELSSHHAEPDRKIKVTPTSKDYQFSVMRVSTRAKDGSGTAEAFVITAKRDLGNGIIETIRSDHEWDKEPWSKE